MVKLRLWGKYNAHPFDMQHDYEGRLRTAMSQLEPCTEPLSCVQLPRRLNMAVLHAAVTASADSIASMRHTAGAGAVPKCAPIAR
jgi:hypothetical protein